MDETLVSRRLFKASEPFETELPREQKLRVRDLKEAYYRSSKNREVTPDDRVAKAFAQAKGIELRKLDLSLIKFGSKESVLPICDVLSLASGLEEMVLDHCELTNEQLRLFLAALLCLKARSEQELDHCRGISKLSLVGNESLGIDGWKSLACFVHMVTTAYIPVLTVEREFDLSEYIADSSIDRGSHSPRPCNRPSKPLSTRNTTGIPPTTDIPATQTTQILLPTW